MRGGTNNWGIDKRDQSIAGLCALVVHALVIVLLLSHDAGNGQSNYKGKSTGRGDSLVAYPMLLTPSATKVEAVSRTAIPAAMDSSPAKPADPVAVQAPSIPNPDISRQSVQRVLDTDVDAHQKQESRNSGQKLPATASSAASASSGGGAGNDLLASYQAAMRAAIFRTWQGLSRKPYPNGCAIHLSQNPGGAVTATSAAACGLSREDRLQLEAAALMAQPMPYAGYESVFSPETDLIL